jgi:hypothetical protein
MGGLELAGKAETAEYQPAKRYSFRTTGIDSTFVYSAEPQNGGSRVTAEVNYEIPQSVLGKVADRAVIERMNERDADKAADSLRAILDT